jgi:cell division protein FtsB
MIDKVNRLSKALWLESLKRLPYIGFLLVVLILAQVYITGHQVAENVKISRENSAANNILLAKISGLSEDNKKLSQDNKALSEQNNRLADQSNHYLDCIAQLFAKHTRDNLPIIIEDLNNCAVINAVSGTPVIHSTPTTTTPTPQPKPQSSNASPTAQQQNKTIFQRLHIPSPRSLLHGLGL